MPYDEGKPTTMPNDEGEPTTMPHDEGKPTTMPHIEGKPTTMNHDKCEPTTMNHDEGELATMCGGTVFGVSPPDEIQGYAGGSAQILLLTIYGMSGQRLWKSMSAIIKQ